jgi:hypothetical protein
MRLLTSFVLAGLPVLACECRNFSVCELVQLPTVFIGEVVDGGVTSIRDDPWYSNVDHVRFKVLGNFRGLPRGTSVVDVVLSPTAGMCAPIPYYPGRTYLVAPGKREGKFYDQVCFQGRDVERNAEDVQYVRDYFAGKMPINVHGQVAAYRDSSLVEFVLSMGEAKALAGVTISTTRSGKTYSAVTNADGRYTLPLPAAGTYNVRAALKPYISEDAEDVSISRGGCAIQDFALSANNTISGRVRDERGRTVDNAIVGLIDLDHRPSDTDQHAWFDRAYAQDGNGTFEFKDVPIGRFALIFNPDGPGSGPSGLPYESTYYPSNSKRATAGEVVIKSAGVHLTGMDLVVGQPVEFRQVAVSVKFADGVPMNTAHIRCVGLPAQEGELPWVYQHAARNGSIEFTAPVNRRLRIEVTDWYGRRMKESYVSTHDAGSAAIKREFTVRP